MKGQLRSFFLTGIVILASFTPVLGQHIVFSGKIVDEKTKQGVGATITISNKETEKVVAVNYSDPATGKYFFVVGHGFFELEISSDGYESFTVTFTLDETSSSAMPRDFLIKPNAPIGSTADEGDIGSDDEGEENVGDKLSLFGKPASSSSVSMSTTDSSTLAKEENFNPDAETEVEVLTREGVQYLKADMYYEPGAYLLSPQQIEELNRIIPYFTANPDQDIEIGGHSDMSDADLSVNDVSKKRANEVMKYLSINGADRDHLNVMAYGAGFPDESTTTKGDRRVVFIIDSDDETVANETFDEVIPSPTKVRSTTKTTAEETMDDGLTFTEEEIEEIQKLYIHFDKKSLFNKKKAYALRDDMTGRLDSIFDFLVDHEQVLVEIQGHADAKEGKEKYKAPLSLNRAKAVVDYLSKNGIELNRITWKGKSSSEAIASNESKEGRAKNRRAQPILKGVKATREKYKFVNEEDSTVDTPPVVDLDQIYYLMLEKYGLTTVPGLRFRVQVGAFINPLPDDSEIRKAAGPGLDAEKLADGITRYMLGAFNTLVSADIFKKDMQSKGVNDAFVVAYFEDARLSISKVEPIYEAAIAAGSANTIEGRKEKEGE